MASKDPVTQVIEHVDLVEVVKGEKVHVEVPVHIVGEPFSGTVVDLEHKAVSLEAEATHVPEFVELRISKDAQAGHHYTAKDITLPTGVKMELPADELIASVVETKAGAAEATEAAAE
jgi:large subunit ribosomal protein L25